MRPNYKNACVKIYKKHASKSTKRMRQFRPPSRKKPPPPAIKTASPSIVKTLVCCILRIECKQSDTHRRGRCLRLTTQSLACQGHPPLRGVFPLDPFPACHPGGATGGAQETRRCASCVSCAFIPLCRETRFPRPSSSATPSAPTRHILFPLVAPV